MTVTYSREYPELTRRQWEVLKYIIDYQNEHGGMSPSIRDIQAEFDLGSPNGVVCHIEALREKGYLHPAPIVGAVRKQASRSFLINWDKIHAPVISYHGGRVRVLAMPKDMTPEKARSIARALMNAAEACDQVRAEAEPQEPDAESTGTNGTRATLPG